MACAVATSVWELRNQLDQRPAVLGKQSSASLSHLSWLFTWKLSLKGISFLLPYLGSDTALCFRKKKKKKKGRLHFPLGKAAEHALFRLGISSLKWALTQVPIGPSLIVLSLAWPPLCAAGWCRQLGLRTVWLIGFVFRSGRIEYVPPAFSFSFSLSITDPNPRDFKAPALYSLLKPGSFWWIRARNEFEVCNVHHYHR